jgi:hypothetical protein
MNSDAIGATRKSLHSGQRIGAAKVRVAESFAEYS